MYSLSDRDFYSRLPRHPHKCPGCGKTTDRIHDYRRQIVKDSSAFGKQVYLHLRKRRYVCTQCGKRFHEINSFLPRYYRSTQRKILNVIHSFRETVSAAHIAKENDISASTAIRYFKLVQYPFLSHYLFLLLNASKNSFKYF